MRYLLDVNALIALGAKCRHISVNMMKTSLLKCAFVLFVSAFCVTIVRGQTEVEIIESIARSHIEANVPDNKHFEEYLKRDLTAFFKKTIGKDVDVEYELLREGPTQTGIAFPKFYAWVIVRERNAVIEQGAVRLAAIEKKRFDVTHFLPSSDIQKNDAASNIFPADVVKKIYLKAGRKSTPET